LIESQDRQCPYCKRQNVVIDQLNPNLSLRSCVTHWREKQNHLSYSHIPMEPSMSNKSDAESENMTKRSTDSPVDSADEKEMNSPQIDTETSAVPMKTGPIIIKMQPLRKSQSPLPFNNINQSMEARFDEEKSNDSEPIASE
jgi:hypothetical protein